MKLEIPHTEEDLQKIHDRNLHNTLHFLRDERTYKTRLWDAINEYVVVCGGDPSKHIGVKRMKVAENIEDIVFRKN